MKKIFEFYIWLISATLWVTFCFILPDFLDNPIDGWRSALSVFTYLCGCGICALLWVYLIGCYRWICAILFPLFCVMGASLAFFRIGYHATLTPMLIDATIHTNAEEVMGVISWQMVVWVFVNLCIALLFICWRWRIEKLPFAWIHCIAALVLCAFYFNFNTRLQKSLTKRFPNNVPYTIYTYISRQRAIQLKRTIPKHHTISSPDSLTLVLVLGEAVRADHIQLNGYPRETTPRLSARHNIISFSDIYSEQTHTIASLPYILTRADSCHEDYQFFETSFVPIFRESGFKTAWISNQDMGSTFTPFIAECDTVAFANAGKTDNVFSKWLDEDLIHIMQQMLQVHSPRNLFIFHSIGSHWYYNSHVPDDMYYFRPITTNRVVTSNTIEQIINSYDNTIRYADFFVDSIISCLENRNALVIFQSDHGEALGEGGEFLHANDVEVAKHPACIIWYSDLYAKNNPKYIETIRANKDYHYRTDYVFYSILTAAGLEAEGDCPEMNIFKTQQK